MENRLNNLSKEELIKCIKKQEKTIEKLTNEVLPKNYDLESRIKKAIDYIHNNQIVFELSNRKGIQKWFDEFYKDLLDILRGEEDETN